LVEKQKILAKLNMKDYRNDFELVLETKKFEEEAKSLLLSVFYKLDNFYKDYISVKKECEPKNDYIENYISLIKNKCNKITIVKPQDWKEKDKYIVDKKNGEVKCIPNENLLFYAIYELKEKNNEKEKYILDDFTNVCVNYVLNKGRTLNYFEPIRDFNGWSWNIQIENVDNIYYNFVYQNLLLLCGYKFLNSNTGKSNIINLLHDKFIRNGFENQEYAFLSTVFKICIILYSNCSKENYEKCMKYKKSLANKINMLNTRKEHAEDTYKNSSDISKKIMNIDDTLNDITKIREEYQKNNKEFFCISEFVEAKEEEKKELLNKIKENNKSLGTKKYVTEKDEYNAILSLYEVLDDKDDNKLQTYMLELQKSFLECFKRLIKKKNLRKDLYTLTAELRYFANLLIKQDENVLSKNEIQKDFQEVSEALIAKMMENKFIETGFQSKKLNYEILKYIFITKMIELENLIIKINFIKDNQIEVEYYDANMLDYKTKIDIPIEEDVTNKKERKIKIFKIGG